MTAPVSFEIALDQLEDVVRALEDGATTLDASLAEYERGVGLLKYCYGQLQTAQQKIVLLTGVDAAGEAQLAPFDHAATGAELKPAKATRRRTPPATGLNGVEDCPF